MSSTGMSVEQTGPVRHGDSLSRQDFCTVVAAVCPDQYGKL